MPPGGDDLYSLAVDPSEGRPPSHLVSHGQIHIHVLGYIFIYKMKRSTEISNEIVYFK